MPEFFKQKVNSYLCIALLCLMTYWVVFYYMTNKAYVIAGEYNSSQISLQESLSQ